MDQPLINIITRASRKDKIKRSIDSVLNQSYKNIHHIITYENKEIYDYLLTIINPDITTLVKVPQYKKIKGLYMSYMHHDHYSNWLEPNWEFLDRKVHLGLESYTKDKIKVKPVKYHKYIGNGAFAWCVSLDYAIRRAFAHFPYNLYLKVAESYLKEGWVIYLDDDDTLYSDDVLEVISDSLGKCGEDTLHYVKMWLLGPTPNKGHWEYLSIGHPPILNECGIGNFIYHSKYSKHTIWDEWRGADYRTASALRQIIPETNLIDKILIRVNT